MALAYDWSYQEWLKTHPKDLPKPVAPKPVEKKKIEKKIIKAQEKPKPKPPGETWSPQVGKQMGFKTRAEWRAWKKKQPYTPGEGNRSGWGGSSGGH